MPAHHVMAIVAERCIVDGPVVNAQVSGAEGAFTVNLAATQEALVKFAIHNIGRVPTFGAIINYGFSAVLRGDVVFARELGFNN